MVLKTLWFSKLRGSQYLVSLHVESKTTSHTLKGTLCFFPKTLEEYTMIRIENPDVYQGIERPDCGTHEKQRFLSDLTADLSNYSHKILFILVVSIVDGNFPYCGGTIIGPSTILTAAHCLYEVTNISGVKILVAEHDLKISDESKRR